MGSFGMTAGANHIRVLGRDEIPMRAVNGGEDVLAMVVEGGRRHV